MRTRFMSSLALACLLAPLFSACSGGGGASAPIAAFAQTNVAPLDAGAAFPIESPPGTATLATASSAAQLVSSALSRSAAGATLYSDDFENGTLNGWTLLTKAWSVCRPPAWSLAMCGASTSDNSALAGSTAWSDYAVQATLEISQMPGNRSGIDVLARVVDRSHFYELELVRESDGSQQWELWKNDGGTWTNLARGYATLATAKAYVLRLQAVGAQLVASLSSDGGATFATLGSANDTRFATGRIGLRAWGGMTGWFDNVLVTAASAASAPSAAPSSAPATAATGTPAPSATATPAPTATPTVAPTAAPTVAPTPVPVSNVYLASSGTQPFPGGAFDTPVNVPQYDPNSATYLASVMGGDYGHIGKLQFATNTSGATDDNSPTYVAHNSDPVYTIHCMYYTNCPLEGVQEHIPAGAIPSARLGYTTFTDDGVHDQHLAVRNVDTGLEVDTWLTPLPGGSGGTLNVGYGGKFAFASGGTGAAGATAAGFALSQGRIRAVDLLAGRIPYALFLVTPCENGHVAPAVGDDGGTTAGCPPIGAHVWLDSTPAQVAASGAAPDFQVILNALHEFGGYIGDRCTNCNLTVALEGGVGYTAFNQPDPWTQIAAHFPSETAAGSPAEYHILVSSGSIDLSQHLHVITN